MVLQRKLRPSIARVNVQLDPRHAASKHTTAPINRTRPSPDMVMFGGQGHIGQSSRPQEENGAKVVSAISSEAFWFLGKEPQACYAGFKVDAILDFL